MSHETATSFLSQISDDSVLEGAKAAEDPLAHIIEAAAKAGFTFSREDLLMAAGAPPAESTEVQARGGSVEIPALGPVATWIREHVVPSLGPVRKRRQDEE